MQLKVEWAKIANDYQQMISGYADKELPGFRKGHVPAKIIESRFGKQIRHDAMIASMKRVFDAVAYERGILPAVVLQYEPGEYKRGEDFSFSVTYQGHSDQFEIPDYKNLPFDEKPETEEEEDELADKISEYLTSAMDITFADVLVDYEMRQAQGAEPVNAADPEKPRRDAVDRLKLILLTREIAKREDITMSDDDWKGRVSEIAAQYRTSPMILEALWQQQGALGRLKTLMFAERVLGKLVKNISDKTES